MTDTPKPGPGRPPKYGQPMKRLDVRLTQDHIETAQAAGDGNASEGIRRLLDRCAAMRRRKGKLK